MAFNREKALATAAKFAAKGQHDRAAKEYAAVVEADPSDIRSWLLLADALRLMGDTKGAVERFMHVGTHYTETGEHQKALAVYRQVLQLDSNRLDVQGKVAGLYKDLGRIQDAISTYEFVAQAYFQAGQIAEGLEGFKMVAELDPGAVGKRLRLAELYSREGMVPQAVEQFRLAAEKLFSDRRIDDYIRVAERLIYHKEDDLPVLRQLARIYLSQNENRRALVKLNALLRSAPADPEGLELLADTFIALGKQDKAVSVLQELAREQRKGGRKAKMLASRVLKKALALAPENAEDLKKIAADIDAEVAALPVDPKERDADLDLDVDVVEEEAGATGTDLELDVEVEDVPSRPFAGVSENVAPSAAEEPEDDNVGDVDKLLLEVRVYIKYKMLEHALGHLDSVFVRDANHVPALELQAQIQEALGRNPEAADTYVRLAQLVASRDPKLAREHVERAQKLAPNHTKAEMVLAALDAGGDQTSDEAAPLVRGLGSGESSAAAPVPPPADSHTGLPRLADVAADMSQESGAGPRPEQAANDEIAGEPVPAEAPQAEAPQAEAPQAEPSQAEPPVEPARPVKLGLREAMQASSDHEKAESERRAAEAAAQETAAAAPAEPVAEVAAAEPPRPEDSRASKPEPREESGLKSLALGLPTPLPKIGESGEKIESALGKTPIPGQLPTRFGEKTPVPLHRLPGEKTPLPVFRPPTGIKKPEERAEADKGETSVARELPRAEGSEGARTLPTGAEQPEARSEGTRKLPTEGSEGTRKLPAEGSEGTRKLPSRADEPEARSEGARKLPTEGSEGTRKLPTEGSEATRTLPSRAEAPAKPEADTPQSRRTPRKGPPTAFKPPPKPAATEEVEELEAEEFEELEAEDVVEEVRPAPKKKGPPAPARPPSPGKRPPASPGKRPPARAEAKKAAPAPVPTDSEAKPAEVPVSADRGEATPAETPAEVERAAVEAPVSADMTAAISERDRATQPAAEAPEAASATPSEARAAEPAQPVLADSSAEAAERGAAAEIEPAKVEGEATGEVTETAERVAEAGEPAVSADSSAAAEAVPAGEPAVSADITAAAEAVPAGEPAVSADITAAAEAAPAQAGEVAVPADITAAAEAAPAQAGELAVSADITAEAGEAAVSADITAGPEAQPSTGEAAVSADITAEPEEAPTKVDEAAVSPDSLTEAPVGEADVSADSEPRAEAPARTPDAAAEAREGEEISAEPEVSPAGEAPASSEAAAPETPAAAAAADLADSTAAPAGEPAAQWPDITDEIEELRFFIVSKFEDDAQFTYLELQRRFPGHPALGEFSERFSTGAKIESAAAPVMIEDTPPPAPAPSKPAPEVSPAQRVERLEDEDDDDFLSAIFDEPVTPSPSQRRSGPQRAVASLDNETDAQTLFDLGMAYHEMGLIDDALTQFGLAARDARWTSRANVMIADLRILRGDQDAAIAALHDAFATANDDDQRDAARYRLAELHLAIGDVVSAVAALRQVSSGYRDRDALLAEHDR